MRHGPPVYSDINFILLGIAIDNFLKSVRGPKADIWEMLQADVFKPIGIHHAPIVTTRELVGWIEAAHPNTTWTTSVCTGSLLLGAAGVLEGQPATTHWCSYDALAGYGATPTEQRVVRTGKVVKAA